MSILEQVKKVFSKQGPIVEMGANMFANSNEDECIEGAKAAAVWLKDVAANRIPGQADDIILKKNGGLFFKTLGEELLRDETPIT